MRYYFTYVVNDQGCTRADSVYISLDSALQRLDTIYACPGDSIFYRGDSVSVGGYQFLGENPTGCDTLIDLSVLSLMDEEVKEVVPVCFGDSLFFRGSWYQPGNYDVRVSGADCDTLYQLIIPSGCTVVLE